MSPRDGSLRTLTWRDDLALAWTNSTEVDTSPFPVEQAVVATAIEQRQQEFFTGRACARAALAALGRDPVAVPQANRRPSWPVGIVGSITHTPGFVGAAVARSPAVAGIGLDAESAALHDPDILDSILTRQERIGIDALPASSRALAATLCFGAKEALYKSLPTTLAARADFLDVTVSWAGHGSRFVPTHGRMLHGDSRVPRSGVWGIKHGCVVNLVLRPARREGRLVESCQAG